MPWDFTRFVRLRKLKNIKQTDLARFAGVSQTRLSECEAGEDPSVPVLEKFADMLDCTTEFLLHRSFPDADESDARFREAASRMAFDVFDALPDVKDDHKTRCRRVIGHVAAPITSNGWVILAEQIELAIGTNGGTPLRILRGGGA
jgi:transcriptional regulator with XRE-family HTH domain